MQKRGKSFNGFIIVFYRKWDRAEFDHQHQKQIAKIIFDGNLSRLGMKDALK